MTLHLLVSPKFFAMNSCAFRFLVFAGFMGVLCLPAVLSAQEEERQRINLFDKKNVNVPRRELQRNTTDELTQFSHSLRQALDPEAKQNWRAVLYFCVFALGLSVCVGGWFFWQIIRKRRMEGELNDPMYLVRELNFVHQLSEPEKRIMQVLTDRNALPSPLTLFVEPKFLLDAWENDLYDTSRSTVRRLLSKLFEISVGVGENSVNVNITDSELILPHQGIQA